MARVAAARGFIALTQKMLAAGADLEVAGVLPLLQAGHESARVGGNHGWVLPRHLLTAAPARLLRVFLLGKQGDCVTRVWVQRAGGGRMRFCEGPLTYIAKRIHLLRGGFQGFSKRWVFAGYYDLLRAGRFAKKLGARKGGKLTSGDQYVSPAFPWLLKPRASVAMARAISCHRVLL